MKKAVILFALFISALFYLTRGNISFAQSYADQVATASSNTGSPQTLPLNTNPDVPQNLSTYTQSVFIELLGTASCFLGGKNIIYGDTKCLGIDPETKKLTYVEDSGGLTGMMGDMIAYTFSIPASSSDYVRYIAGNFGIAQDTTAQEAEGEVGLTKGAGFDQLRPILPLWTTMRNLTYLMFVIVFIILGLGIMFRLQIDPRAVMTIQSQIPKIVIALVLITFSYAIAGFFVDMMYLSLYLIIDIFSAHGIEKTASLAGNPLEAVGGVGGIGGISWDASKGVAGVMSNLFDGNTFAEVIRFIINSVAGTLLGGAIGMVGGPVGMIVGGLIGGIGGNLLGFIPGLGDPFTLIIGGVAWLIIVIAMLTALFRLWFILIKTYIFILVNIIFAPFYILFGLFPGSSLSFGGWVRSLVSNLAAFPVVLMLFTLGKALQDGFIESPGGFTPPYVGDPGDMKIFAGLIGLGIILLAPEAVNMTKSIFKAPDFKFGGAIGQPLGTGQKIVGKTLSGTKNALWHTNPYTNEPSRFKAAVKEQFGAGTDKIPGVRKVKDKFNQRFPSYKARQQARADTAAKRTQAIERESERLKTEHPDWGTDQIREDAERRVSENEKKEQAEQKNKSLVRRTLRKVIRRGEGAQQGEDETTTAPPPSGHQPSASPHAWNKEDLDRSVEEEFKKRTAGQPYLSATDKTQLRINIREELIKRGPDTDDTSGTS